MGDLAGAVLTGGRSRRMGRDKALLPYGGSPLALRPAAALREAGASPVVAVGGDLDGLRAAGLDAVADPHQGDGPLGGIATALEVLGDADAVVVLACDLPDVTAEGVRAVVAGLASHDVAVPSVGGRLEPLHAAWRPSVLPVLAACLAEGERAVRDALARLDVVVVEGLDARWLRNLNSPSDLGETGQMNAPQVPEIDVDELARRHAEGAYVLDVRRPDEYEEAHVPGAVLVPLDQLPDRQGELPKDRPLLVICRSGARSATAVEALSAAGYDATNVAGGTLAWIEAGNPVAEGPSAG
jgi:molybdopterin-guanine dinucleotide biosynthesis protein A/rhodanese-related sulfurtransferase